MFVQTKKLMKELDAASYETDYEKSRQSKSEYLYVRLSIETPDDLFEDSLSIRISDHPNPAWRPTRMADRAHITDFEYRTDQKMGYDNRTRNGVDFDDWGSFVASIFEALDAMQENLEYQAGLE